MTTLIKLRLKEWLDQDDQGDIRVALLNYVIEEDADTSKLKPDHYMIRALLPYLNRVSTNWKGLIKEVNFVGSPIHKHMLEYLKNQLRDKGRVLRGKVKEALTPKPEITQDQGNQSDTEADPSDNEATLLGKRSHQADGDNTPDQVTYQAPTKK